MLLLGFWLCLSGLADATDDKSAKTRDGKAVQLAQHGLMMRDDANDDDPKMPTGTGKDKEENANEQDGHDDKDDDDDDTKNAADEDDDDDNDDGEDDDTYKIAVGITVPLAVAICTALGLWKFNLCRHRRAASLLTAVPAIVSTVEPESLKMHETISPTPCMELVIPQSLYSDALNKIVDDCQSVSTVHD